MFCNHVSRDTAGAKMRKTSFATLAAILPAITLGPAQAQEVPAARSDGRDWSYSRIAPWPPAPHEARQALGCDVVRRPHFTACVPGDRRFHRKSYVSRIGNARHAQLGNQRCNLQYYLAHGRTGAWYFRHGQSQIDDYLYLVLDQPVRTDYG